MKKNNLSSFLSNLSLFVFAIIVIFLFLKINVNTSNNSSFGKFDKLNIFFKVVRLIDEKYVNEPDINLLTEGAISGMLNKLDPHSVYINKNDYQQTSEEMAGEFEGIGIEFSIIDDYITVISPIIDGPSYKAGIQSGDQIIKINGESAYKIETPDVLKRLKGPKGTEVNITIKRKGENLFDRTLIRDRIPLKAVTSHFMINNSVGYIKLSKFSRKTFEEFSNSFIELEKMGMQNLLLDLRNNPGGLLDQAIDILDMFINSNDTLLYTKGRIPSANTVIRARYSKLDKNIPIITIINRGSASASEIISGTLQDLDRGLVIGETSFGKGSVQQHYDLDDSTATRITVAKFYTPSGRAIQRDYQEADDVYYENLDLTNRELTDSLKSTLPKFKTKNGREVYGGGGINPDIYFRDTTLMSTESIDIIYSPKRPIFNYTEFLETDYNQLVDYNEFIKKADSGIAYDNFIKWIELNNYDYNSDIIKNDWELIKNRIIAELANKVFDRSYYYKTLIMNDKTVLEALNYFDEAKTLLN